MVIETALEAVFGYEFIRSIFILMVINLYASWSYLNNDPTPGIVEVFSVVCYPIILQW